MACCSFLDEEELSENTMLGLGIELSCFPTFNMRWTRFASGLDRVISALHRTLRQRSGEVQSVHAPLVPVLTQLMLHFIDEWEVFALLSHLLNHTGWLDYSRDMLAASHSTLLSLLHSHAVSFVVCSQLERLLAGGSLSMAFQSDCL